MKLNILQRSTAVGIMTRLYFYSLKAEHSNCLPSSDPAPTRTYTGKVLSRILIECRFFRAGGITSMTLMVPGHREAQGMQGNGEDTHTPRGTAVP